MKNDYVLAMYDVRGKQQFIYRSEHLKEIIGGSAIIRDVFDDYLYDAAKEVRNKLFEAISDEAIYRYEASGTEQIEKFSFMSFEQRMQSNQYIGEVVYNGGGNFFILYKSGQICREVTASFTRKVLQNIGTLKVICTYISDIHPDNYKEDVKRLYQQHRYTENQEAPTAPYGTLPIVQTDYLTSMPLTNYYRTVGSKSRTAVTKEAFAKYRKYDEIREREQCRPVDQRTIPDEKILDNLVTQKGEESLLAVIYIDGNNMGAKVAEYNKNRKTYEECINSLRRFSSEIQRTFIDDRKPDIDAAIRIYSDKSDKEGVFRLIVGSGDEITIITNARAALQVAKAYLEALPSDMSSCAGISIFHSHTPFAEAYRIAEECCENGKQYMKKRAAEELDPASCAAWQNACMLDYHYNQGVIGVSLEDIRVAEETADLAIPWIINGAKADSLDITYEDVLQMKKILFLFGRSNVKGLLQAARESRGALTMEVHRIHAHMDQRKADAMKEYRAFLYDGDNISTKARNLMIRMIPVYDIWFGKETCNE